MGRKQHCFPGRITQDGQRTRHDRDTRPQVDGDGPPRAHDPEAATENVAQIWVRDLTRLRGVPNAIVSDGDARFTSGVWRWLCRTLDIQRRSPRPTIRRRMGGQRGPTRPSSRCWVACCRWSQLLPLLGFTYNSSQHSSTKSSPFELLYRFVPSKPSCRELGVPTVSGRRLLPLRAQSKLQKAKGELQKALDYQKKHVDKTRRPLQFKAGQWVWLRTANLPVEEGSKALRHRYRGHFQIRELIGEIAVKLDLPDSLPIHPVLHVALLLPATADPLTYEDQDHSRRPNRTPSSPWKPFWTMETPPPVESTLSSGRTAPQHGSQARPQGRPTIPTSPPPGAAPPGPVSSRREEERPLKRPAKA